MIEITQAAAREIKRMKATRHKPDSFLRLTVKEGGCSGLFYCLELESFPDRQSKSSRERYFEQHGVSIATDEHSYLYLKGIKLDYSEDLMGGSFRFQNPNVSDTCGCGISFSSKMESNN